MRYTVMPYTRVIQTNMAEIERTEYMVVGEPWPDKHGNARYGIQSQHFDRDAAQRYCEALNSR